MRGIHVSEYPSRFSLLVDKQKKNQDVIVCGEDNVIRHIPAKNFMIIRKDTTKAPKGQQTTGSGEKPLQTVAYTLALKGRQDVLPPLRGCIGNPDLAGVSPLPAVCCPFGALVVR